jgi:hypothetical protein
MKPARKLRIVPTVPKPLQYGFLGGHKVERLAPMPLPHEITIRARYQSLMTKNGVRPELVDYETALRGLAEAEG